MRFDIAVKPLIDTTIRIAYIKKMYDAEDDVRQSVREAFLIIRERMKNGGPGWTPHRLHPLQRPSMDASYQDFLRSKELRVRQRGLKDFPPPSDHLFPFQAHCVDFLLRTGCGGLFLGTGLGKTEIQLDWCQHLIEATNKPALIMTPLAVAGQTRRRAERWGYDACIVRDQFDVKRDRINICNYERMEKLDLTEFEAIALDEASILKSFTGKTTQSLIAAFSNHRFKLAATATPTPNDYMEFGNYAEFLDAMAAKEMLSRFFINDTSQASQKWRLKNNAVEAFWDWIASFARMGDMPSDLGDTDDGFILQPFNVISHRAKDSEIVNTAALNDMFGVTSLSATNLHDIKRQTIEARAEATAGIVNAERGEPWILWVDTNYEADALRKALPNAVEVRGSQSSEEKEEKLNAFALGQIRVLIGKPSMIGFGCDWSHCARMAFVGRSYSWETWYQAVRRCWRFGQKRQVDVHLIVAEGEDAIGAVLDRKSEDNEKMKVAMRAAMRRAAGLESQRREIYDPKHKARLPSWMQSRKSDA